MKPKYFLLLCLSFYILNSTFSTATIRYVSKTGSSTFPYTSWQTAADSIQKCINICSFGDTVYVANGIYQERIDMILGLSLVGAGMDSCIIDTRNLNPNYSINVTDSCYLTGFQIISFDNANGIGISIYDFNIEFLTAIVERNLIKNAKQGIRISSSTLNFDNSYKLVRKNKILDVESGIYTELTKPIIYENIIFPRGYGLGSGINSYPLYYNNTVILSNALNASSGFGGGFDYLSILKNNKFITLDSNGDYGIESYSDSVENNLILGPWGNGVLTAGSSTQDAVFKNNHIENTQTAFRYDIGSGGIPPVFQYNNLWQNQNNYQYFTGDTTNIYSDPMFVNEDSSDYHLQMYSPLIDAGDPNILDKDGSRSDMGLYGGLYGESYQYLDLAPRAPINLTALVDTNYITLNWNRNTEADTAYYKVFRDTVVDFTIDSTQLVSSSPDTFFVQINPHNVSKYVYKVTCVDKQGNESEPSEEVVVNITSVSIDDYPMTISDYRLYQNYPNPFNPSTTISYRLKERGYVKLYVYDIKGELVSVLVNKVQEAGFYQVEFSSSGIQNQESSIQNLASGIYIYQIHIIGENNIPVFTDFNKMILIK